MRSTNLDRDASKHLDLGCGNKPRNPFRCNKLFGTDLTLPQSGSNAEIRQADLFVEPIPWEADYFNSVSAYDFLEHVPRVALTPDGTRFPFIELMNEVWRVLQDGGRFYASTPAYPHSAAFQDPTHVNFLTRATHVYFTRPQLMGRMYGFHGEFECISVKPVQGGKNEYEPPLETFSGPHRILRKIRHRILPYSHLAWEFTAIKRN